MSKYSLNHVYVSMYRGKYTLCSVLFYIGIVGSVNEWNAMEFIHIKTAMPQLRADIMDAQM